MEDAFRKKPKQRTRARRYRHGQQNLTANEWALELKVPLYAVYKAFGRLGIAKGVAYLTQRAKEGWVRKKANPKRKQRPDKDSVADRWAEVILTSGVKFTIDETAHRIGCCACTKMIQSKYVTHHKTKFTRHNYHFRCFEELLKILKEIYMPKKDNGPNGYY